MYVRVVRFTDATRERVEGLISMVEAADGPPEGVKSTRLNLLYDESQQTAIAMQYFETVEDMEQGGKVFAAMDAGETPGTRVSIDMCEIKLEVSAP